MGLPSSTQIIEYVDRMLEASEIVYGVHGAAVERLENWNGHRQTVVGLG